MYLSIWILIDHIFFLLKVYNGHAEAVLSDTPNGQAGSSIKYQAKLVNTNFDKFSIDYDGQIEMVLSDGKNLVDSFSFKNVPKGDKYDVAFRVSLICLYF